MPPDLPKQLSSSSVITGLLFLLTLAAILALGTRGSPQGPSKPPVTNAIPDQLGWYAIPDTALAPNCPDIPQIHGVEGCSAIIDDWGSALADTKRNRLILWGGGHNAYFGNEIYSLDLQALTFQRLTDPSQGPGLSNLSSCPEAFADGKPNTRHTYNGLQYLSKFDRYFVWGAGLSPCGNFTNFVWIWDPAPRNWSKTNPARHPNPAQNGSIPLTAYDLATGAVFEIESNTGTFWQYDVPSDNWTDLGHFSACGRLNLTSSIDPKTRSYFCVGNGIFDRIAIDRAHKITHLKGAGCDALRSAAAPGFDFDSSQNHMVGWAGNGSVYTYNSDLDACTRQDFPDGPGPQQPNGTFGRFRYFPDLDTFALVNDSRHNAFLLRLALPGPRRP
jgi:hypothetical protein